jgi:HAD superfamily hydrolase (TIGR01549 family)
MRGTAAKRATRYTAACIKSIMPSMMTRKQPCLIFDAGGTLVFPEHPLFAQWLREEGVDITSQALCAVHNRLFASLDYYARQHGRLPPFDHHNYVQSLLQEAGIPPAAREAVVRRAVERDRRQSLWMHKPGWVATALAALQAAGYRLAVISNADGRAEQIMVDLGLIQYLEAVIDSAVVGVSKPHQAIFDLALEQLGLRPEEAIYVGDLFYVDVWGANQAGLGAIHLDPDGLYDGWPGVRLANVGRLPKWLASYDWRPGQPELYPARDLALVLS